MSQLPPRGHPDRREEIEMLWLLVLCLADEAHFRSQAEQSGGGKNQLQENNLMSVGCTRIFLLHQISATQNLKVMLP